MNRNKLLDYLLQSFILGVCSLGVSFAKDLSQKLDRYASLVEAMRFENKMEFLRVSEKMSAQDYKLDSFDQRLKRVERLVN